MDWASVAEGPLDGAALWWQMGAPWMPHRPAEPLSPSLPRSTCR